MAWTKAQQKAIVTRNKNLLVSAAAGSGKTAVLVERIITMISEGEQPLDIDHLLVVTFTNAAAAEMRERIGKALDKKLCEEPENEHLQKQLSLLQSAQITTIHSFCLNVIRNYFHRIDLDPSFKIADESDITLMKSDIAAQLLERWYEEGREDFHSFIESYSYSKSDAPIEELILRLYEFSMSSPWPEDWINDKRKMFEFDTLEDMYAAPWMMELLEYTDTTVTDLLVKNMEAVNLCNESGGPTAYLPALLSDRNTLEALRKSKTYETLSTLFLAVSYERLSSKREDGVLPGKKEKIKSLREEIKKSIKDLNSQYFFQAPEEMLKDIQSVNRVIQVLFDLTLEFMADFAKKKEEKNLIDFNDLEHFALKILVEDSKPTQAAVELSEQFDEILIDEYQDSNLVQETILRSISREDKGSPNRFMVGDVKQSIYKFRLAMPEIFMEKYARYSPDELADDGSNNKFQKIDLDQNFRSRKTVLDYVNQIFDQIMQKPVGGIVYDEAAALKYGGTYEDIEQAEDGIASEPYINRIADQVDLLLVTEEEITKEVSETAVSNEAALEQPIRETSDWEAGEDEEASEAAYTKKELEALIIAGKIKELTDPDHGMLVTDKDTRELRPATFKDIVILLRSMTNWSEVLVKTLMAEGIPAYADTGTGYFQTLEVMTILNMLRIIDNPRQDIPLTGVLYSPMVGITSTQLAMIRANSRSTCMYTAVLIYAAEGSDEALRGKLSGFIRQLEDYRSMLNHKPIHEIIQLVLDRTGYHYYISTMPGGNQRKANIDMLVSQAVNFEKGSYSGLFHFIRYIEKLHKYEVDFGEASASGDQDNTVRIMSIHKSKGLEFPVVFLAGMGKQFNEQDLRSNILLHSEMGVGPEYIDNQLRTKVPTLLKKVMQKKVQTENLGEELRVLYVAMTRAREKLILTGYLKSMQELRQKRFTFSELLSAKSFLDWVLPAMLNRMGNSPFVDEIPYRHAKNGMEICIVPKKDFIRQEMAKQLFINQEKEELQNINPEEVFDLGLREEIKSRINYTYPHRTDSKLKIKMTVSELKKLGQYQDDELSLNLYENKPEAANKESEASIPNFIRQKGIEISGTDRGTLYHKVLELLDLSRIRNQEDLIREIQRMADESRINPDDIKKLKLDYIYDFTTRRVAERMRKAQSIRKLYKEKQFVIGRRAYEVLPDTDSDELILIQGIIDVFFEEDGELVLLDYKSDLVDDAGQLIRRYRTQLEYYGKALEQMLHKKVKEKIIYSLPLAEEIRIDD